MHTRTRCTCLVLVAALAGLTPTLRADDHATKVAELVEAFHDVGLFDGAVLVAAGDEVVYEGGVGFANVEWEIPNGPDIIIEPLGMHDTGYDDHAEIIPRRASGYEREIDGVVNCAYLDMSIPYAAGAIYSSVRDLHVWDRALTSDTLLPAAARARMFEPFLDDYAYGWRVVEQPIGENETARLITHGGGINGFNTVIARFVDEDKLVVLLSNHGRAPLSTMARQIHRVLRGEDYEPPVPPLERALVRTLLDGGVDAALAYHAEHQAAHPVDPRRLESQVNDAGYQLLARDRTADAITVFEMNVRLFPESFNTWDSLGEALAANGEREAAIEHYEKSLELNPENTNAETMLRSLWNTPAVPAGG